MSRHARLVVCALLALGCAADPADVEPDDASAPAPDTVAPDDSGPLFSDVARPDVARPDVASPTPGSELCNNALDDDGDGRVDDGCPCVPGSTQRCYGGRPAQAGVGACTLGVMRCNGTGEFGTWGECAGWRAPAGDACDGVDNDCDGRADNNCVCRIGDRGSCYTGPLGTVGVGACRPGTRTCSPWATGYGSIWSICTGEVRPARDVCDGVDNDCNGTVDDGCACTPGSSRACYGGPAGTMNVGACRGGRQSCAMTSTTPAWGACAGQTLPRPEVCGDGADNDCNGRVDDGCECTLGMTRACYGGPAGTQRVGACRDGSQPCVANPAGGTQWGPCAGWTGPAAEVCDGADNDCNRTVDEGCACRPGATQSCYTGPAGTAGRGICLAGAQTCVAGPRGVGSAWSACAGQVLPMTETCNRADDDCDGAPDDGLSCSGPTVTCPPPQTAPAGTPVTLTATSSSPGTYLWDVVSPPGALVTFGSAAALSTTFTSVIVGTYAVRFTATDAMGRAASCMTTVTMQGHGLRVEMTWDTDGNDLDLHVHNAAAAAWFDATNDCYFRNRRPAWDAAGTADDPALDTDDTNGRGPENIRVDAPPTSQEYSVGVHYWAGTVPSNATVRIYCGDQLAAPAFVRSLQGGDGMTNDFWRVARVRFTSASACTVTPVNDVVATSAARAGSP
ncbi:MAG: MopE-related protein [Polyangiales bacterium]